MHPYVLTAWLFAIGLVVIVSLPLAYIVDRERRREQQIRSEVIVVLATFGTLSGFAIAYHVSQTVRCNPTRVYPTLRVLERDNVILRYCDGHDHWRIKYRLFAPLASTVDA